MGNFSPNKLNPTPTEGALLKAAEDINSSLRSRAHLLAIIDGLNLAKTSLEIRMVYVLALLNLGFSRSRAIARMSVSKREFNQWVENEENQTRLEECEARGELILEETMLLAAESDPKAAMAMLMAKDKKKAQEEKVSSERVRKAEDFFYGGLVERGLVREGEIVKEGPSELT
jgi:hypothetical protein